MDDDGGPNSDEAEAAGRTVRFPAVGELDRVAARDGVSEKEKPR
jgi:hypothetical protein